MKSILVYTASVLTLESESISSSESLSSFCAHEDGGGGGSIGGGGCTAP